MRKNTSKRRGSLIQKMAALISVVFIVSVSLMYMGNFVMTKQVMHDHMNAQMSSVVEYYESEVHSWTQLRMDQLEQLGEQILAIPSAMDRCCNHASGGALNQAWCGLWCHNGLFCESDKESYFG